MGCAQSVPVSTDTPGISQTNPSRSRYADPAEAQHSGPYLPPVVSQHGKPIMSSASDGRFNIVPKLALENCNTNPDAVAAATATSVSVKTLATVTSLSDVEKAGRKAALNGLRNKRKIVSLESSSDSDSDSSSLGSDRPPPGPKQSKYAGLLKRPDVAQSPIPPTASLDPAAKPSNAAQSSPDGSLGTLLLRQAALDAQFFPGGGLKGLKLKSPVPASAPAKASRHSGSTNGSEVESQSQLSDLSSSEGEGEDGGLVGDFLVEDNADEEETEVDVGKSRDGGRPPRQPSANIATRAKPGSAGPMPALSDTSYLGSPVSRPGPSALKIARPKGSTGEHSGVRGGESIALTSGELFEGGHGLGSGGGAESAFLDEETFDKDWEHLKTLKIVFNRAGLDEDQQRRFVSALRPAHFTAGSYIVHQGDPGDAFYIVTEGEVAVTKGVVNSPAYVPRDVEVVITHLYEGHFFGETSLVTDAPRNANVKVVSHACTVMAMSKADFTPFLQQDAKFRELITELVRKKEETAKRRAEMFAAAGDSAHAPEQTRNEVKISLVTKKGRTANGKAVVNGYVLMQKLGAGAYGTVYLAMSLAHSKKYAIKVVSRAVLRKKRIGGRPAAEADGNGNKVLREVAVMKRLQHPHLTSLFEVLDDPNGDKFYLVQEFMELGAVMTETEYNYPLASEVARGYFRDVLSGLEYLHFQGVIHRDIKPSNILIGGDGTAKLADFGAAAILPSPDDDLLTEVQGTPAFQPPEVFLIDSSTGGRYHGFAVDVWSLGATLHCMSVGAPPYMAATEWELVEKLKTEEFRLSTAVALDPHLRNLLLRCLTKNPSKRITLSDIMTHPWVTSEGSEPMIRGRYKRLNLAETKATVGEGPSESARTIRGEGDSSSSSPPFLPIAVEAPPSDNDKSEAERAESDMVSARSEPGQALSPLSIVAHPRTIQQALSSTSSQYSARSVSNSRRGIALGSPLSAASTRSPAASSGVAASQPATTILAATRVVSSGDDSKADAALEKQRAHLRALRLRQHALLSGHTTLSKRERDVLAEQKRVAFHADRALATVEELYMDSRGMYGDKPMTMGTGGSAANSSMMSMSNFSDLKTRRTSLESMALSNRSMRLMSPLGDREGNAPRAADRSDVPQSEAGSFSAEGNLKSEGQEAALALSRNDASSARSVVSGLPGMIRNHSSDGDSPCDSPKGLKASRRPVLGGVGKDSLDSLGEAISEDDEENDDVEKPPRRLLRGSGTGPPSTSDISESSSGGAVTPRQDLTRHESESRVASGLTRKEDFLMLTAEVDAAEGGGSMVRKVIFRAKGTEGSLSITGGRSTMGLPQGKHTSGTGLRQGAEGLKSHPEEDIDSEEEEKEEEEYSDGDDYEGISSLDVGGVVAGGLDAVLAELAGGGGSSVTGAVGGGEDGDGVDHDFQSLSTAEAAEWATIRGAAQGLLYSYDKCPVSPADVACAQDNEVEAEALALLSGPVKGTDSKRHALLATKDKDKEALKRKLIAERARKAEKAKDKRGAPSREGEDDDEDEDSDSSGDDSDIGGLDDDDWGLTKKKKKGLSPTSTGRLATGASFKTQSSSHTTAATIPALMTLPASWNALVHEGRFVCCPVGRNAALRLMYGSAHATGRRATMEDRTVAIPSLNVSMAGSAQAVRARHAPGSPEYGYFAVYDGHNGTSTCEALAQAMHFRLAGALRVLVPEDELSAPLASPMNEAQAFVSSSLDIDKELLADAKAGESLSGSTAIMLLVGLGAGDATHTLTVANVGDSRAVLCRGGSTIDLSFDHKCTRADEKARILAAGGSVIKDRLHGILAVSRAFGDAEHKRPLACEIWGKEFQSDPLTAEPEVTMENGGEADEFIVLACDGVWDVLSSEQVVAYVRRRLLLHRDVGRAARELVAKALHVGTIDNVSVLIVAFTGIE